MSSRYTYRPTSLQEFEELKATVPLNQLCTTCCDCKQPFTSANVTSAEGWKDTQLIETCEKCFDSYFGG